MSQKKGIWGVKGPKVWTVFAVTLAALTWSAVVGTQPVHAAAACTTTICAQAEFFARGVCASHHSFLVGFTYPSNNGFSADDFIFFCQNGYGSRTIAIIFTICPEPPQIATEVQRTRLDCV
jgi:hypothetical protein